MRLLPVLFSWLLCLSVTAGYRILAVCPFNMKSHFIMFNVLLKGLASKGHHIDVISSFPEKRSHPNYTDILTIPTPLNFVNNVTYETIMQHVLGLNLVESIALTGINKCEYLGQPEMLKLLHNPPRDPPYDIVLYEVWFCIL